MRSVLAVVPLVLLVVACGDGDDASVTSGGNGGPTTSSTVTVDEDTRYTATTTVLESPDHGPQLCLGGILHSYPPQCEGPDVVGWDWEAVDGEETANGTTWGEYTVVGTWDGEALTLTEPARVPEPDAPDGSDDDADFSTPCPEPEGGWHVVEPAVATDAALEAAGEYARDQATFGGMWVDQSINPALDEEPIDESQANDPTRLVLNVTFTDDLERHEVAIREIWGGALCVSEASVSSAELAEIRSEVEAEVGDFLYSSTDEMRGRVQIGVAVDDGLQQRFDERYGSGVVDIEAQLRPVE